MDASTARTLLAVCHAYQGPFPLHIVDELAEIAGAEHLPHYVRRDASGLLRRGQGSHERREDF